MWESRIKNLGRTERDFEQFPSQICEKILDTIKRAINSLCHLDEKATFPLKECDTKVGQGRKCFLFEDLAHTCCKPGIHARTP